MSDHTFRMTQCRSRSLAGLGLALAITLTGCGSSGPVATAPPATTTATATATATVVTTAPAIKVTVTAEAPPAVTVTETTTESVAASDDSGQLAACKRLATTYFAMLKKYTDVGTDYVKALQAMQTMDYETATPYIRDATTLTNELSDTLDESMADRVICGLDN